MRIGIDCFKLIKGHGKSIGIYNVAKFLVHEMAEDSKNNDIIVFGNKWNKNDFNIPNVQFIEVTLDPRKKNICIIWELFQVNKYCTMYALDTILFPRGFMPLHRHIRSIIIVHDLIPFYYHKYFPNSLNKLENFYIMYRLKKSIKSADEIITISEFSKNEIVKLVPTSSKKTHVVWNGIQIVQPHEITENKCKYILGITSKLPHKNAIGIVKSYIKYCEKYGEKLDLVLVGIDSIDDLEVEVPNNIKNHIRCERFLNDKEYMELFINSEMLLFLSLIEGFGLPPLEAMQLKVPVIASNCSCLPEIISDAGILVDVDNYDIIADSIHLLSNDEEVRKEYIHKGNLRIQSFSWREQIQKYYRVIEK